VPGCFRQLVDLLVGKEHVVAAPDPWKVSPTCRIGTDAAASYSVIKRGRGHEDGLPYPGGTKFSGRPTGDGQPSVQAEGRTSAVGRRRSTPPACLPPGWRLDT
jgi:hypothetical protein